MAKQKRENWFKHQFRAREDEKLIRLKIKHKSSAPIGVYWQLVEMIYENDGFIKSDIEVIAYQLGDSTELVKDVIDNCFHLTDNNEITHPTIITQLEFREEKYQESVEKGIKGANKRWGKDSSTMVQLYQKDSSTITKPYQKDSSSIVVDSRDESREYRDKSIEYSNKGVLANSIEAIPETPIKKKLALWEIERLYPNETIQQHYERLNAQ